jgi:hypothetical protein
MREAAQHTRKDLRRSVPADAGPNEVGADQQSLSGRDFSKGNGRQRSKPVEFVGRGIGHPASSPLRRSSLS